jgi:hypothetical protein
MFGDLAKSETFLNIKEKTQPEERSFDNSYFKLWFALQSTGVTQERRVNNVLDMVGDVGGLYDATIILFGILISIVIGSSNHYIDAVEKIFSIN